MKRFIFLAAEHLAHLQKPTSLPIFASVAKRCGTRLPAWLAGRDQQQQAHADPGHRPSSWCCQRLPRIMPRDRAICRIREVQTTDFGLCSSLHEEDSNFSFLEWLAAFRGNWRAHIREAHGSGCSEVWYHERAVGTTPSESTKAHQGFHHLCI